MKLNKPLVTIFTYEVIFFFILKKFVVKVPLKNVNKDFLTLIIFNCRNDNNNNSKLMDSVI